MRKLAREKKRRLNEPLPPEQKKPVILDRFGEGAGMTYEEVFAEVRRRNEEEKK